MPFSVFAAIRHHAKWRIHHKTPLKNLAKRNNVVRKDAICLLSCFSFFFFFFFVCRFFIISFLCGFISFLSRAVVSSFFFFFFFFFFFSFLHGIISSFPCFFFSLGTYFFVFPQDVISSFRLAKEHNANITKTRLFKYIENFSSKNLKFSDKKLWYFSYFCSKHRLWVLVKTASVRRF